jgi:hypothetical protein
MTMTETAVADDSFGDGFTFFEVAADFPGWHAAS